MSQMQETTTNRLVTVIQAIQLERGTGLLTVRRGEGVAQEEGAIVFTNGQVMQASVGRRSGPDALNWLSTWGMCRYIFMTTNVTRSTQPLPSSVPNTPTNVPVYGEARVPPPVPRDPLATRTSGGVWERSKVPMRIRHLDECLRMLEHKGLSRTHRLLLFYIDGARLPQQLAQMLRCEEKDVLRLLQDLENVDLIRVLPDLPGR